MGRKQIDNIKIFSVVLDKSDWEKIYNVAKREQTSISHKIRQIIRAYLESL